MNKLGKGTIIEVDFPKSEYLYAPAILPEIEPDRLYFLNLMKKVLKNKMATINDSEWLYTT